jgi:hypothetical protein
MTIVRLSLPDNCEGIMKKYGRQLLAINYLQLAICNKINNMMEY